MLPFKLRQLLWLLPPSRHDVSPSFRLEKFENANLLLAWHGPSDIQKRNQESALEVYRSDMMLCSDAPRCNRFLSFSEAYPLHDKASLQNQNRDLSDLMRIDWPIS